MNAAIPQALPAGLTPNSQTSPPPVTSTRPSSAGRFSDAIPAAAPGTYLIASLDGAALAAIGPRQGDAPVEWDTYIAVDDADAAAAAVREAGGVTLEPVDAGPGGRLAACPDPRGARFRLWQPRRRLGAHASAAAGFYAPLFGWEFDDGGFATMMRRPGYGDHRAGTVDPGIKERQDGIRPTRICRRDRLARFGGPAHLDRLLRVHPVAEIGLVAVDLGRVEVADECQDTAAEHLTGHQHGEPGRIRRDERRRHHVDTGVQFLEDLVAGQVFAVGVVVRQIERATYIAFGRGLRPAVVTEDVVEAAEVGLRRRARGQTADTLLEPAAFAQPPSPRSVRRAHGRS
jgi:predicted enzyme related to lactoylglutathione lyase